MPALFLKILKFLTVLIKRGNLERDFVVMIEIASITVAGALGNEARLHFLMINLDPVNRLEPAMPLDVHTTLLHIAVSSCQIHLQNVLQYVPQFFAEMM